MAETTETFNTYSFIKVTYLPDIAVNNNIENISYIGDVSYILLSYNGKSYKVSTNQFLNVISNNVKVLNDKIDFFINNSHAQPREYDATVLDIPQEKYIYTYYVTNQLENQVESNNIDFGYYTKFTILSYALYSELENEEKTIEEHQYNTYNLSNGIVTGELLNAYMAYSIDNVLGVPGTLTYVTDAIDSISEFAAWFDGVKNDSSYTSLISYIEYNDNKITEEYTSADYNIILSYEEADRNILSNLQNKQNTLIPGNDIRIVNNVISSYADGSDAAIIVDEIISSYTSADDEIMSYVHSSYAYVLNNMQPNLVPGENITIEGNVISSTGGISSINQENNKKFQIGNVKYSLQVNSDGELFIGEESDPYNIFEFVKDNSTTSSTNYEYNSPQVTVTLKGTPNKDCKITALTNISGTGLSTNTPVEAGTTITATGTSTVNSSKTFTLTVKENDLSADEIAFGHTPQSKSLTCTIDYSKYKVYVFWSQTADINSVVMPSESNNQPINITTNAKNLLVASIGTNNLGEVTINTAAGNEGYIYFLLPSIWDRETGHSNSSRAIFWQGNEALGDSPGAGRTRTGIKLYGNSINYTLYQSQNVYQNGDKFNLKFT